MFRPKIFLSYRTTNSRFVRLIAAWLRHNGLAVWFAEERIGLDKQFDASAIRKSLQRAVSACSHCLMFTNEEYIDSKWCKLEAHLIRTRSKKGKMSVLEIGIPATPSVRKRFTFLSRQDIGRMDLPPQPLPDLEAIETQMRRRKWPLPNVMNGFTEALGHDVNARLDTPLGSQVPMLGWRPADEGPSEQFADDTAELEMTTFRRSQPISIEASVSFLTHRRVDDSRPLFGVSTDREVRDWMMRQDHLFLSGRTVHGIHIDFMWGRAQLGITYSQRQQHPTLGVVAGRLHWCSVYDSKRDVDVEIRSRFFVYGGLERLNAVSPLFEHYLQVLESTLDFSLIDSSALDLNTGESKTEPEPVLNVDSAKLEDRSMSTKQVEHLLSQYVVFERTPPAKGAGILYRPRQVVRWLTGYW